MTSLVIDRTEALRLFRIFERSGLSTRSAWALTVQLHNWEVSKGLKWVVDRLKLHSSFFKMNGTKSKHNCVKLGIKLHNDGSFVGAFRPVWILANSSRHGMAKAFRILNVSGRWKAEEPGESEYLSFAESIGSCPPYSVPKLKLTPEDKWLARHEAEHSSYDESLSTSDSSFSPFSRSMVRRSMLSPELHVLQLDHCPNLVARNYKFLNSLFALKPIDYYLCNPGEPDIVGGVKGLTKDRALKVRFIANPSLILQAALSRLKRAVAGYLDCLPESCVRNQDKGLEWIKSKLSNGNRLSSIDLSKCSDNLPAREQFTMLRELFGPHLQDDIDLFEDVSRSEWFCPFPSISIRWAKGQPLGTNPSFASFTVFHIMVIRACGGNATNFRVIGDDVVFSDNVVVSRVLKAYDQMGVQVNVNKSIHNNKRWAEFAGRIVDRFGTLLVFRGKPLSMTKDPLGFIRQYGLGASKLVPRKQRLMVMGVAMLPKPFGFGSDRLFEELPPRLVYELLTPRFKPKDYARVSEVTLAWQSEFRIDLRPEAHLPDGTINPQTLLGERVGVRPTSHIGEDKLRLKDHVKSWHGTPLEDVPKTIQDADTELSEMGYVLHVPNEKELSKAQYRREAYQPISYVRRIWNLVCSVFKA